MIYRPHAVTPPARLPLPRSSNVTFRREESARMRGGGARSRVIIRDSRRSLGNARQADPMLADRQYGSKHSRPLILRRPRRIIESRRLPFLTIRSPNNTFVQRESGESGLRFVALRYGDIELRVADDDLSRLSRLKMAVKNLARAISARIATR